MLLGLWETHVSVLILPTLTPFLHLSFPLINKSISWGIIFQTYARKLYHVLTLECDSGVHPASYPVCTGLSFPGGKAAGT